MPQLVYIEEKLPHSFMVMTTNGEGFVLRDFSAKRGPAIEIATQHPGVGTAEILAMARQPGNYYIPVPERAITDYAYWHKQTLVKNKQYLPPSAEPWSLWLRENLAKILVPVAIAVLTAIVLAWLGLKK